ncbi:MAG: peptide deformylase [Armatimonadia bacterium]
MALRDILICSDPILRKKAPKLREVDDETRQLLDDMVETMIEAPGVGLAAPQVGECKRCIVVRDTSDEETDKVYKIINPRLRMRSGEQTAYEGCLSLPTLHAEVTRPMRVKITGLDENGEPVEILAEGLTARAFLHEMDHLDGILFVDRADPETLAWLVPDESEEDGYRMEDTTMEEIMEAFERLRQRKAREASNPS